VEKLIIIRHGDYDPRTWNLTSRGRRQIAALAERLAPLVNHSTRILVSPTKRTRESADELVSVLGGEYEVHFILESSGGHIPNKVMDETIRFIESTPDIGTIILVTHFEFVKQFPAYYGVNKLEIKDWREAEIDKGGAAIIDCVERTLERIQPLI
jgi:phosphohistidine phosphatase SixA